MGFLDLFKKSKPESNQQDFAAMMDAKAKKRDDLYNGQCPDKPDYGYSPSNPIMTSSISSTDRYLQRLRTEDGKSFTWKRVGSFFMRDVHGVESVMVDEYKLLLDGEEYKSIFICPYGHNSSFAPQGIVLGE